MDDHDIESNSLMKKLLNTPNDDMDRMLYAS